MAAVDGGAVTGSGGSGGTAFALAGLGGSNAHGSGFLAAAAQVARDRGGTDGLLPGLEMISCTSGAIASTATYLRGGDLREELAQRIAAVERATAWLPRGRWAEPLRIAAVTGWTGLPGVFGGVAQAYPSAVLRALGRLARSGRGWLSPLDPQDIADVALPARMFVPELTDAFFEQTAQTLAGSPVGVACNSFDPRAGVEYLYVNQAGLDRIRRHHDPGADYGRRRDRTVYCRIEPAGLRAALWLFYYGFDGQTHVDGAYARSLILDELTFADRIWLVTPVNHRWLGRLPRNLLEVLDLQTELWMGTSRREQVRTIELINRLGGDGRTALQAAADDGKNYHHIALEPVEIEIQRDFFSYFIESMSVFDRAYQQAHQQLLSVSSTPSATS